MASPEVPLLPDSETELDESLTSLERFLGLLGFCQHTLLRATLSWLAFILLSVALPLVEIELSRCSPGCEKFEIETFELEILVSRAVVAGVSLFCVSWNLRKYGIRKSLFVDRFHGRMSQFRKQYVQKIRVFYYLLASWFGVCFVLKAGREVARLIYLHNSSWWLSIILFFVCLISWSYSTLLFLSGCALFNLVGNLQIIHFENYGKVLEKDLDVSLYIEEHMNLTFDLSKISHRFRNFLLLEFFIVTASQFVALLQATENQGIINLVNGGDFAVLSIVQLVGILLCLTAAAKISHRAQSLGSIASRWHALATCNSNDGPGSGNAEVHPSRSLSFHRSESDLESADYKPLPRNIHLTPSKSSYQKRQAFVTYMQSNTGGFTIFGWIVDRMLINTIFFIELSLVFFVLGKTITVTACTFHDQLYSHYLLLKAHCLPQTRIIRASGTGRVTMMLRQSPRRTQRSKGMKVKHVLQVSLLLGVCIWLVLYQMPLHGKSSSHQSIKLSKKLHDADEMKLGRKDLKPRITTKDEIEEEKQSKPQQEESENAEKGAENKDSKKDGDEKGKAVEVESKKKDEKSEEEKKDGKQKKQDNGEKEEKEGGEDKSKAKNEGKDAKSGDAKKEKKKEKEETEEDEDGSKAKKEGKDEKSGDAKKEKKKEKEEKEGDEDGSKSKKKSKDGKSGDATKEKEKEEEEETEGDEDGSKTKKKSKDEKSGDSTKDKEKKSKGKKEDGEEKEEEDEKDGADEGKRQHVNMRKEGLKAGNPKAVKAGNPRPLKAGNPRPLKAGNPGPRPSEKDYASPATLEKSTSNMMGPSSATEENSSQEKKSDGDEKKAKNDK